MIGVRQQFVRRLNYADYTCDLTNRSSESAEISDPVELQ